MIVVGLSLLVWAALFREFNSLQIFKNITVPIVNVTIVIFLSQIVNSYRRAFHAKTPLILTYGIVAIAITFQVILTTKAIKRRRTITHDEGYLKAVEAGVAPNSIIGCIKSVQGNDRVCADKYNAIYPIGSLSSSSGEELLRCEYKRSLYSY